MASSTYTTNAGTALNAGEIGQIASLLHDYGRMTLLVPSYAEGEVCRRNLADADVGTGVDVVTPKAWIAGLWEQFGDGSQLASTSQRRLLMAQVLADADADEEASTSSLKNNPGSVNMLAEMARECYPYVVSESSGQTKLSRAEQRSIEMLKRYGALLDGHSLIEPSAAAEVLGTQFSARCPACARAVAVRGVTELSEHLLRLLEVVAQNGSLAFLYNDRYSALIQSVCDRFDCAAQIVREPGPHAPEPSFAEVCGPTARAASYTELAVELGSNCLLGECVAIGAPDPMALLRELGPRLATHGISAQAEDFEQFARTRAGQAFFQLIDLLDRMDTQERSAWWPAPEVADWVRSPFSGVGPFVRHVAVALDTQLRKNRGLTKQSLFAQLDSMQSRELNRERARAEEQGRVPCPVVVKDVIDALDAKQFSRALRLMHEAAKGMPPSAFGTEGLAAQCGELFALQSALEVLEQARILGVSDEAALTALRELNVSTMRAYGPFTEQVNASDTSCGAPCVSIMRIDCLAEHEDAAFGAVLLADVDAESYPLTERDTVSSVLAAKLGCTGISAAAAACQRDIVARCLQAARHDAVLSYVSFDDAAEKRFPALAYAELRDKAAAKGHLELIAALPGEHMLYENLDAAGGEGACVDDAPRMGEHVLDDELAAYVLLRQRSVGGRLVTRTLSASQIENYLACPYRWFVNNRVASRRLDVEFGPIEIGNFSHDVMQRFYERLVECGVGRITPENVDRCHEEMDIAFDEMCEDHANGRYTHGKYSKDERPRAVRNGLVALDELERARIDALRARFHRVVDHDAVMLSPYVPTLFEYSFDKQGVTYAGRPLGGRIDRVDFAPSAGNGERFVVIDYKTGANAAEMACADPTMQLDENESLPSDWLPGRDKDKSPKVQTLMYASALERVTDGQAQGAVYYGLRGPSIAGAVSNNLTECEPPAFPDDKLTSFPGVKGRTRVKHDGTMEFSELLSHVEHAISLELDRLQSGDVAPRPTSDSCKFCPLTMCEKRR